MATIKTLKQTIAWAGRRLDARGLISGSEGNISATFSSDKSLITGSGCFKGNLKEKDIIVTDSGGNPAKRSDKISSEAALHFAIYGSRDDIGAVVHAHPPYSLSLNISGNWPGAFPVAEAAYMLGYIPVCNFAVPGTEDGGRVVSQIIENHDVLMLDFHGAVTTGKNVKEAVARMEMLENCAKIYWLALQVGEIKKLADNNVDDIEKAALELGVTRTDSIKRWTETIKGN